MAVPRLCGQVYVRPTIVVGRLEELECQYISGHGSERHSWDTLKVCDLDTAEQLKMPTEIRAFIKAINDGHCDDHLEAILAAGHGRKRERRGIRLAYGRP